MSKYLIVSDIHLGYKKDSEIYHNVSLNLFKSISDYCSFNNIKNILILGDFFHNRVYTNLKTMYVAFEIAEILNNFNTYILTGNHDLYFKNSFFPHSLQIFKEGFNNIKIIDKEPCILEDISLVPWLFTSYNEINTKYLFGHFEINGFPMSEENECYGGISSKIFNKFEKVVSGHFHIPSQKGNIVYVGSPYQMDFGDYNSKRGFYEFEDGELKFIEFNEYPKFKIFFHDNILYNEIENNNIKIIFNSVIEMNEVEKIIEKVNSYKPLSLMTDLKIFREIKYEENSEENLEIRNSKDVFKEFLNKVEYPNHISKNIVKKIVEKLF